MKNTIYFTLNTLFILKIFKFLSSFFVHIGKLDWRDKVNFKVYDLTTWLTNNCYKHIDQHLRKLRQSGNEIWSFKKICFEKHFSFKVIHKMR